MVRTVSTNRHVAVVDPALGFRGVHHLSIAKLLAQSGQRASVSVEFWGSRRPGGGAFAPSQHLPPGFHAAFSTDSYELIKQEFSVSRHWNWVQGLAREYAKVFAEIAASTDPSRVQVLHHTLSCEHAAALSLGIQMARERGAVMRHECLLMYAPGVDPEGVTYDGARRLRFFQTFWPLHQLEEVRLYASCDEYAESYRRLLDLPAPLPVHPCLVLDVEAPVVADRHNGPSQNFSGGRRAILYLGIVKEEKGFFRVPDVLSRSLRRARRDDVFLVQFVRTAKVGKRASKAIADIERAAARDERVLVIDGFLDDADLVHELRRSGSIRLDYDAAAYSHKTSGLLWMAVWYGLQIAVPSGTWLEREACRLGADVRIQGRGAWTRHMTRHRSPGSQAYREALFQPFLAWLLNRE